MKPNRTPVLNLIEAAPSAEEASDDADGRDLELGPPPLADDPLLRAVESVDLESRYEAAAFTQESQSSQFDYRDDGRPKSVKQTKIFEFAKSLDEEDEEEDDFYRTLNRIYVYFNRKKKMSTILMAIHQCGGDVREAVTLLAKKKGQSDVPVSFNCNNITAPRDVVERYFRV